MAVRLLAIDIDGTLVDGSNAVSPRARAALTAAAAAGIEVVLATGRPYLLADDIATACAAGHVVASNGTSVHTVPGGGVLFEEVLRRADMEATVRAVRSAIAGVRFMAITADAFAWEPGFDEIVPLEPPVEHRVDDVLSAPGDPVHKLGVFHREMPTAELLDALAALLPAGLQAVHMGMEAAEVTRTGVDKQRAVAWLCERLGISPGEVVAFGDNVNDRPLLRWAGHGVAMADADAGTRDVADEVAPSLANDGVAVVVERLLGQVGQVGQVGGS